MASDNNDNNDNNKNNDDHAKQENMNEVKSISLSNDKFSTKLYNLLRKRHQNLVFSPFSISVVMVMLSTGARGETLKHIKKGLFFPPHPHSRQSTRASCQP